MHSVDKPRHSRRFVLAHSCAPASAVFQTAWNWKVTRAHTSHPLMDTASDFRQSTSYPHVAMRRDRLLTVYLYGYRGIGLHEVSFVFFTDSCCMVVSVHARRLGQVVLDEFRAALPTPRLCVCIARASRFIADAMMFHREALIVHRQQKRRVYVS